MKHLLRIFIILLIMAAAIIGVVYIKQNFISSHTTEAEHTVIMGKKFYFLTNEEKESLREPLIALLSNQFDEFSDNPQPADPTKPSIPTGYACGLFDVTGDGIPELLVHPRGFAGSSGLVCYYAYDIRTGKSCGRFDSGNEALWSNYYVTTEDKLCIAGSFWTQSGWSIRERAQYLLSFKDGACLEKEYLGSYVELNMGETEPPYSAMKFYIEGNEVSIYNYYDELDKFTENYIRIPETDLQVIYWSDITTSDNPDAPAIMANALLSSTQKFIVPQG